MKPFTLALVGFRFIAVCIGTFAVFGFIETFLFNFPGMMGVLQIHSLAIAAILYVISPLLASLVTSGIDSTDTREIFPPQRPLEWKWQKASYLAIGALLILGGAVVVALAARQHAF